VVPAGAAAMHPGLAPADTADDIADVGPAGHAFAKLIWAVIAELTATKADQRATVGYTGAFADPSALRLGKYRHRPRTVLERRHALQSAPA